MNLRADLMEIKNFYRLGTVGEGSLFREMKDYYFGIVIGAHFVAFYPNWLPTFLGNIRKPFFIDPVTYVFARDIDNIKKDNNFKKSYEKLIKICGKKTESILRKRQLIPKDFEDEELLEEFVNNIISFQKNIFRVTPSQQSILEYTKILGKKTELAIPLFLTTPYFYFSSLDDPWYKISVKVAKQAMKLKEGYNLYAVICCSKELLLDDDFINRIVKDYDGFDGYLLWVSNFDEKNESKDYLSGLISFVKKISKLNKETYTLYGEYFSLLITKMGLAGYSRSICYGESKGVDAYVTGGRPPKRYYFDLLCIKLTETTARTFFSDNPDLLCKCKICSNILKRIKQTHSAKKVEEFFDSIDFVKEAKQHFMVVHKNEIDFALKSSIDTLRKDLEKKYEDSLKLNVRLYGVSAKHIERWIQTF